MDDKYLHKYLNKTMLHKTIFITLFVLRKFHPYIFLHTFVECLRSLYTNQQRMKN